jgi:hypothetical protein
MILQAAMLMQIKNIIMMIMMLMQRMMHEKWTDGVDASLIGRVAGHWLAWHGAW